jgi:hypothetical protein
VESWRVSLDEIKTFYQISCCVEGLLEALPHKIEYEINYYRLEKDFKKKKKKNWNKENLKGK